MSGIKIIFGGGAFMRSDVDAAPLLKTLQAHACQNIDTATLYGESEAVLGRAGAGETFVLDTKHPGSFMGDGATHESIVATAKRSRELLGGDVDVYYLHSPSPKVPLEDTIAGINEVYQTGFFKRFGLSNFAPTDVRRVHEICVEKGYAFKPQVYQGNYNPVARRQETELFPTLRELGLSFYAYSPLAGGFLTKTKADITAGKGRFDANSPLGQMYSWLYNRPSYIEALEKWDQIARDEGTTPADLAYRWVRYNSPLSKEKGDGIIIGARTVEQLDETLKGIEKGPLSDKAVAAIDEIWESIKHEAPLDNYEAATSKK